MATLKDIAEHCDLSISLVSKVLNNKMGTSSAKPQVVKSIREAAKELGYRKNLSAEALRALRAAHGCAVRARPRGQGELVGRTFVLHVYCVLLCERSCHHSA